MKLKSEDVQKVLKRLGQYRTPECVICGHDDWAVATAVFMLPDYRPNPFFTAPSDAFFPVIPITCKVCGNVLFLSAIAAEVVSGSITDQDIEK